MLTGEIPPHYSDILECGLPEINGISPKTSVAIERAMESKKSMRPSSVEEFLNCLVKIEGDEVASCVSNDKTSIIEKPIQTMKSSLNDVLQMDVNKIEVGEYGSDSSNEFEETVMLNVPQYRRDDNVNTINTERSVIESAEDDIEFLDLGLSVKWATKLSGRAFPIKVFNYKNGSFEESYTFVKNDESSIGIKNFINEGNCLPEIKHFEELLERCSWTVYEEDGIRGYKVKGPNGNVLILPLGVLNYYMTRQTLEPDRMGYCYFLYLGEYSHTLTKGIPTEANIWTIKK